VTAEKPLSEADLYEPVKAFLEARGYEVKGEVRGCDVVATRGDEPPLIVELKLRLGLPLILQGVDRLNLTDTVYLAVPKPRPRSDPRSSPYFRPLRQLCRRLGLGLIVVHPGRLPRVEVLLDPAPYQPRKNARKVKLLMGEHLRRTGDPNRGGSAHRGPIMTAYRQEALRCAQLLNGGIAKIAELRATGYVPNAGAILQRDAYGWFERVSRGCYVLTPLGVEALVTFAASLEKLETKRAAEAALSEVSEDRP